MISRRSFLTALCAIPLLGRLVPKVSPPIQGLAFHPDAYAFVMKPARYDVMYGWGTLQPTLACRILDYEPMRLQANERIFDPERLPL